MTEFKNVEESILSSEDIYTKKTSKSLFILLVVAGIAVTVLAVKMSGIYFVGVILFCIALGMIILGLVGLSKNVERIYCKYTKELMVKQVIYFDAADKERMRTAIKEGDKDVIKSISKGTGNNMRAIVYATPSYSYSISQLQAYVPYRYVPVEQPVICNICQAS